MKGKFLFWKGGLGYTKTKLAIADNSADLEMLS